MKFDSCSCMPRTLIWRPLAWTEYADSMFVVAFVEKACPESKVQVTSCEYSGRLWGKVLQYVTRDDTRTHATVWAMFSRKHRKALGAQERFPAAWAERAERLRGGGAGRLMEDVWRCRHFWCPKLSFFVLLCPLRNAKAGGSSSGEPDHGRAIGTDFAARSEKWCKAEVSQIAIRTVAPDPGTVQLAPTSSASGLLRCITVGHGLSNGAASNGCRVVTVVGM